MSISKEGSILEHKNRDVFDLAHRVVVIGHCFVFPLAADAELWGFTSIEKSLPEGWAHGSK